LPDMTVVVMHGVLSPAAEKRLAMPELTQIVLTDTIPFHTPSLLPKTVVISVAHLLAEAILRLHQSRSISELFRSMHEEFPV